MPTSIAAVCSAWRPEPTAELHVCGAQAELLVEDARELVVVVLARVGDHEVDVLGQLGVQRRRLDELRAGAGDGEEAHCSEGTRAAAACGGTACLLWY